MLGEGREIHMFKYFAFDAGLDIIKSVFYNFFLRKPPEGWWIIYKRRIRDVVLNSTTEGASILPFKIFALR